MTNEAVTPVDVKPRSRDVTDGMQKAPARSMLRAIGMTDDDWVKPQVGVASAWNEVTPCNMTLRKLAQRVKDGVRATGGFPMEFGTITVSDGISMGHEGMRASLVSREVITDSVETVMHAERLDGFVGLAGCDKSIPAMLMAAARLDLASVFVYNGSIMPGQYNGRALDITSVFEAVGACAAGTITEDELLEIEKHACPGEGACGGMFTANTMSSIAEALGMSLPGCAAIPAPYRERGQIAYETGVRAVEIVHEDLKPSDILTRKAFENSAATIAAAGGSTNGVLHMLALAREAQVDFTLRDLQEIFRKTPVLCSFAPRGTKTMVDLHNIGGTSVLLKHLIRAGVIDGSCLTVTGKTIAENVANAAEPPTGQDLIAPVDAPFKGTYIDSSYRIPRTPVKPARTGPLA